MEILNSILAPILDKFKAKNPKIFLIIMVVLGAVYLSVSQMVSSGYFDDMSLLPQIIQGIDLVFMAVVGSKTAPYLKEYLDNVGASAQAEGDSWLTKLLDNFKVGSPLVFGIVSVLLLTSAVAINYALAFDLIYGDKAELMAKILSYIDIGALMLLGSRTGKYIVDHPISGPVITQSVENKLKYYD